MATTELGRNTRCANCGRSLYKGERVWVKRGFGKTLALGLYQATTAGQSHLGKFYCSQGCLDEMTGSTSGNSGSGAARGGDAAHSAMAKTGKIEVMKALTEQQAAAEERNAAKNDNYMSNLRSLTFTGDAQAVSTEMEDVHQMWISQNFVETEENKKAQKKLVQEKLEYGLMSLKSLDAVKGKYYEDKINQEIAHRKKILKIKIIGGIVGGIVLIGFLVVVQLSNG